MIHGDACFAYFNKIWGIPVPYSLACKRRDLIGGSAKVPTGLGCAELF
jgi:hypothetical protein